MNRQTEEIMQRVIMDEFESHTIITVSHRLKMVMDYDTVLVTQSGRSVERGNPKTLSMDEKSRFGQLWSAGEN
jgi:ABC-type multidrug transport system fused ATPase/permease subunit